MTGRDSTLRTLRRLRASAGLAAVAGLASVSLVSAQPAPPAPAGTPSRPPATAPQTPPPVAAPPTNGQPVDPGAPNDMVGPAVEEAPPAVVTPPPPLIAPPPVAEAEPEAPPPKPEEAAKKAPEPPPLRRPRENVAIFQALDKITAETLRFQVQIGKPVRYKNLVFTVRACERSAGDEAMEDSVAYVVVESQPKTAPGKPTPPARQAFRGWMYASSPGLHPLEHPVYDAWLITCRAS